MTDAEYNSLRVHPAAEDFPMLGEIELADLAADIKANGLNQAITLDAAGETLIDGRNRLAACEIAGVEPRFERLNGHDPEVYIVSQNVKRRNTTAPQRAIGAARAWARAEAAGRIMKRGEKMSDFRTSYPGVEPIPDPAKHFAALYGVSQDYVRMARAVLAYSEPLAIEVRDAVEQLDAAYALATRHDRAERQRAGELSRLREVAPDLIERTNRGELTFDEARALYDSRDRENRELRRSVFHALRDVVDRSAAICNSPVILTLRDLIATEAHQTEFREYFNGGIPELVEGLKGLNEANSVAAKLIADLERKRP